VKGWRGLILVEKRWEHFPHQADIGVRGIGCSKEEAFEQAAIALTAVITDPTTVTPNESVDISCEAPDDELLFVDWLNALIYETAIRKLLFCRFDVSIADHRLNAKAWGEVVNLAKHQPAVEVKGATYTALHVRQTDEGAWIAQCVVDV
jgi:tRNA nucleotidyltransferase (CCA-adding enzyme)